ncbi:MAG TPA: DUF4365 domain-containing protein [Bryobacteraceae bacterium]|jgi:hypothetical protein|nr:DUF4365 domain-containing protein [Bryobacteraceae bacterium]
MGANHEITGQEGVFAVGQAITKIGWYFHPKSSPEFGIDGEIELADNGKPSGKLLKVQIKTGPSWFRDVSATGFTYRGDKSHLSYWLSHSVPVLLLLHDTADGKTYWEEVTKSKIIPTGKGWKIDVPKSQVLNQEASDALRKIANRAVHALPNGMWSRHEQYELQDDYVKPVPGSRIVQYDPWQSYSGSPDLKGLRNKPYITFARLGRDVLSGDSLTNGKRSLVVEWTTNYGLLGLLPGLAQLITLWPRWERSGKMDNSDSEQACLSYARHIRVGGNWYSTGQMQSISAARPVAPVVGEPVPKSMIPAEWPKPGVLLWRWEHFNWQEETLQQSVGSYFPNIEGSRETYDYPCPGHPRFWSEYAEPVRKIARWAKNFHDVLISISAFCSRKGEDESAKVNEALYFLESLASAVAISIELEAGTRKLLKKWQSPSLLSSFAMMAIEDMASGYQSRFEELIVDG